MSEFEKVRGQFESLWNAGVAEGAARARKSGEAAATEAVLQAAERLADESDHGHLSSAVRTGEGFVRELRRRVSQEPGPELMTAEEWEARYPRTGLVAARPNFPLGTGPVHHLTQAELAERIREEREKLAREPWKGEPTGEDLADLQAQKEREAAEKAKNEATDQANRERAELERQRTAEREAVAADVEEHRRSLAEQADLEARHRSTL